MEDAAEDERKELVSKIDSLESIVRMLELKTKNSHDHGINEKDTSSQRKTLSSRVVYFEFILYFISLFIGLFQKFVKFFKLLTSCDKLLFVTFFKLSYVLFLLVKVEI